MDQITKHKVDQAANDLIASIDPSKVCELATSFHPDKKPCRIFSEWKKGSYNVCFPVVFGDGTEGSIDGGEPVVGEKWMVRIPLIPRLAFPEEKMRSEIATMKYVAEKTTIPIPRLHGYSIKRDNILGLPFMFLEYVDGQTLLDIQFQELGLEQEQHLHTQLADIYLQLHRQQFDRIGALTLDGNDEHWIFGHNRPMTVDINEQELAGLDACNYLSLSPRQTFASTVDYVYMITKLIFNDFYRGPDSIIDESDAKYYLYSIFASQSILMEWVKSEYNHGPFILMHGDLRPPNIILDNDLNIVSILDWEWSHTVPAQLFVPPYWLTGQDALLISRDFNALSYTAAAQCFCQAAQDQEFYFYNPERQLYGDLPLAKLWDIATDEKDFFIAHGLLKPHYFGSVYCNALDRRYYGDDADKRVKAFFELKVREPELQAVKRKVIELAQFEKKRLELGIEQRVTIPQTEWTPEKLAEIKKYLAEAPFSSKAQVEGNDTERAEEAVVDEILQRNCSGEPNGRTKETVEQESGQQWPWPLIAAGAIYLMYTISRKLRK